MVFTISWRWGGGRETIHYYIPVFTLSGISSASASSLLSLDLIETLQAPPHFTTQEAKLRLWPNRGHYKCHNISSIQHTLVGTIFLHLPLSLQNRLSFNVSCFTMLTQLPVLLQRISMRQPQYRKLWCSTCNSLQRDHRMDWHLHFLLRAHATY